MIYYFAGPVFEACAFTNLPALILTGLGFILVLIFIATNNSNPKNRILKGIVATITILTTLLLIISFAISAYDLRHTMTTDKYCYDKEGMPVVWFLFIWFISIGLIFINGLLRKYYPKDHDKIISFTVLGVLFVLAGLCYYFTVR